MSNSVQIPPLASPDEFRNRVVLVTGGTNGLGRHLCQTLISLGAEVCFCGRKQALGNELVQAWGSRAHFYPCDLADAAATAAFVAGVRAAHHEIDYLVNNAAIDPMIPFEDSTVADFDRVVATNLRAYFQVTHCALPLLRKGRGKSIVNLGTTNWMIGTAHHTIYAAAKSGILGFSRSLAHDLGPEAIRVNMVSPGWIMTERQLAEKVTTANQEALLSETALHCLLTEDYVTPATLFLLSSAAAGITGQNLVVDGGKYLQ